MKVLHVFGVMDVGGAELRTLSVFEALSREGVSFQFATLSGREGVLRDRILQLGGSIHPVRLGPGFLLRFWKLLRTQQPGAVHSHVATFSGLILLMARLAGVPQRIAHFRSDGDGHERTLGRRLQRTIMITLISRCATDIVGVTPASLTYGYRADWQEDPRTQVIPNGVPAWRPRTSMVNLRDLIGLTPTSTILIHVGRSSPEKNRIHAVRLLRALHDRGADYHLALVGAPGPDTESLLAETALLGLSGYVHDIGRRPDATDLIAQANALLLPSVREGLPGVVLEAASVGTPVIASELPGVAFIAQTIQGIRSLSLRAPLDEWCRATMDAVASSVDQRSRQSIVQSFQRSPFILDSAVAGHRRLYASGGRQ